MTCFARCVRTFAALFIQYSIASTPEIRLPPKQSLLQQTLNSIMTSSDDRELALELALGMPSAAAALASFNERPYKKVCRHEMKARQRTRFLFGQNLVDFYECLDVSGAMRHAPSSVFSRRDRPLDPKLLRTRKSIRTRLEATAWRKSRAARDATSSRS